MNFRSLRTVPLWSSTRTSPERFTVPNFINGQYFSTFAVPQCYSFKHSFSVVLELARRERKFTESVLLFRTETYISVKQEPTTDTQLWTLFTFHVNSKFSLCNSQHFSTTGDPQRCSFEHSFSAVLELSNRGRKFAASVSLFRDETYMSENKSHQRLHNFLLRQI